ncbi:hypothetical protein YC2023_010698 [Brassica napus]
MKSLCTTSRSDFPRATHQGRSRPLVRRHQNRASWSDLSERPTKVAPSQSDQPRATISSRSSQSDQPERPARVTSSSRSRFDGARHEEMRRERPPGAAMLGRSSCFAWTIFMLFQGPFGHLFCCFTWPKPKLSTLESQARQISFFQKEQLSIHNASSELATQKLIDRHFPPKRGALKTPNINNLKKGNRKRYAEKKLVRFKSLGITFCMEHRTDVKLARRVNDFASDGFAASQRRFRLGMTIHPKQQRRLYMKLQSVTEDDIANLI